MEILQHSLKNIELKKLNNFQLEVWNILKVKFKFLIPSLVSNDSSIEMGMGVDVFLKINNSDFILYLSIADNRFLINSKFFDIYIYPETKTSFIELILDQVLLGKYIIKLGFNERDKLVFKYLIFDDERLVEFNDYHEFRIFRKRVSKEQVMSGVKFITES